MCGLAGTVGPAFPELMALAAQRGPHCYGVARDGALQVIAGGRYRAHRSTLGRGVALGHCRMASDGQYYDMFRAQPLVLHGLCIAHNGVIREFDTSTQSDTRTLLERLGAASGGLDERLESVMATLDPSTRYAIALTDWDTVLLARRGLPLYTDGRRWCSLPFGRARALPDGGVIVLQPEV